MVISFWINFIFFSRCLIICKTTHQGFGLPSSSQTESIAIDRTMRKQDNAFSENSDPTCRRYIFSPLHLKCLFETRKLMWSRKGFRDCKAALHNITIDYMWKVGMNMSVLICLFCYHRNWGLYMVVLSTIKYNSQNIKRTDGQIKDEKNSRMESQKTVNRSL